MAEVTVWAPGTLYQPGDLVRATNSGVVVQPPIDNPGFEDGDTGWTESGFGSFTIDENAPVFEGTWSAKLGWTDNPNGQTLRVENDEFLAVTAGQIVTMRFYCYSVIGGDYARLMPRIQWYNAAFAEITGTTLPLDPTSVGGEARVNSSGLSSAAANSSWTFIEFSGVAPAGAVYWRPRFDATWGDSNWTIDSVSYSYAVTEAANTLIFRAVQAAAGFSGNSEPTWPTVIGNQVVDNEVTWEAVSGNSVTWEASRILVTGAVEPTWPVVVNGSVVDNTISWQLDPRRVTDSRVPTDSTVVLLASSKVFAGDDDIINFSATVNPLDWSTPQDAGYIGFGLQQYGNNPVTAMGLYRGNLAAFNSQGCQLWQLDEDPAGIAYLDAIPVACTFPKSVQPVGDDLGFLSDLGIRSLGMSGASVNLQGGYFGQQIDQLVIAAIKEAVREGWEPMGLYWPARGQAWWFFGAQAFVLTIAAMDGGKVNRSWSRYVFPEVITDWTLLNEDLYLRTENDRVWNVDHDLHLDDVHDDESDYQLELGGGNQYGLASWDALDDTFPLGATQSMAIGTPVFLFGPSLTGLFSARTITVGAAGDEAVTCNATMAAAVVGSVLVIKRDEVGPYIPTDGNTVGSTELELDEELDRDWPKHSVVRIARAGGTDWNFLSEAAEEGSTTIKLVRELENTVNALRLYPPGANITNANSNALYDWYEITAVDGRRLTLDRELTADAVDCSVIACRIHETVVDSGVGTTDLIVGDAVPFANAGGTPPELGFPAAGIIVRNYAELPVGTPYTGVLQWPFLDWKAPGLDKELVGFDLIIDGEASISIGYNQRFPDYVDGSPWWTTPYDVNGDTLPEEMVPYSCSGPTLSMRLEFEPDQAWEWFAANMYVKDLTR